MEIKQYGESSIKLGEKWYTISELKFIVAQMETLDTRCADKVAKTLQEIEAREKCMDV